MTMLLSTGSGRTDGVRGDPAVPGRISWDKRCGAPPEIRADPVSEPGSDRAHHRSAGEERIAVDLVGPGVAFPARAAEGVDGVADDDVGEADVGQDRVPARTGQPAGYLTGPEVDVPQRALRHRAAVGDVGELQPPARPE